MRIPILITVLLLFVHNMLLAQAPGMDWQKCLGGTGDDRASFIRQTYDGGYIVAAKTSSGDGDIDGPADTGAYWIIKLDQTGAIQWQKRYGGTGIDAAYCIREHSGGGYICAGETRSTDGQVTGNHGSADFWIVRLDDTGAIAWQQALGGPGEDVAYSIQKTSDGRYIAAGNSTSTGGQVTGNHGGNDIWVVKLYASGTIKWEKSLGGSEQENTYCIMETRDSNYVLIGSTNSNDGDITYNHGDYDCWVVKLNDTGGIIWQKTYGGSGYDAGYSIIETSDSGYVFVGTSNSNDGDLTNNLGFQDYWIVKINDTGKILWQRSMGGSQVESAFDVQQTSDSGYIVAGISGSNDINVSGNHGNAAQSDMWVVKLNSTGGITWEKCLGGIQVDVASSVQQTFDTGYVLAGYTYSIDGDVNGNHGYTDAWVVKLGKGPADVPVMQTMKELVISPNPSNGYFTIRLPDNMVKAELTASNMLGEIVLRRELNEVSTHLNVARIPGVYFIRIDGGITTYASKLIVQ